MKEEVKALFQNTHYDIRNQEWKVYIKGDGHITPLEMIDAIFEGKNHGENCLPDKETKMGMEN